MWLDAAATLSRFTPDGRVDRHAFFDVVGRVVRTAAASGRPVHAYGEMVAPLWEAGNITAAIDLETHWNELATEIPFALYCAYRSESVSGHEHADALATVCHLHSAVVPTPVAETTWRSRPTPPLPATRAASPSTRSRSTGHDPDLLDDVQIVLTELAANAVVRTASPFSVSLRSRGSIVRILGARPQSRHACSA